MDPIRPAEADEPRTVGIEPAPSAGPAATVWLTGLSGSGKSTLASLLVETLRARGSAAVLLDGDEVRRHLTKELGYTRADRDQQVERVGWLCELLNRHGVIAVAALISPYRHARATVRDRVERFIEVYVDAPLAVLEARDPKGYYRRARASHMPGLTGIDDPYEPPEHPDVICRTDGTESAASCVLRSLAALDQLPDVPAAAQTTIPGRG
jgi:adenylylsulfate kinase